MNSMERVLATISGEPSDRPPFTLTLSLYGAKLTACPLRAYYSDPELYFKGQNAVVEQCRPDIIFTPFALALEAQAFGSEIVYFPNAPPNVRRPCIRSAAEIAKINVPDVNSQPGLLYLRQAARLLAARYKGTIPICGVMTAHTDLPAIIMGIDAWLETLMFDRRRASVMLSFTARYFLAMANGLFADGIDFLALPMIFCNPRIILKKTVEEIIMPALTEIFQQLKGPVVFHHGGNPIGEYLQFYKDLPNVAGFVIDSRDSFSGARKALGDDVLLMGNLDGPSLSKISPQTAVKKVKKIIDERRNDRHFILASTSADVPYDTPIETIAGIYDLLRKREVEADDR